MFIASMSSMLIAAGSCAHDASPSMHLHFGAGPIVRTPGEGPSVVASFRIVINTYPSQFLQVLLKGLNRQGNAFHACEHAH